MPTEEQLQAVLALYWEPIRQQFEELHRLCERLAQSLPLATLQTLEPEDGSEMSEINPDIVK